MALWNDKIFVQLGAGEQSLVKWQYQQHGSFFTALWDAISRADEFNLRCLERAFPLHVAAYKKFISEPGWWESIQLALGLVRKGEM